MGKKSSAAIYLNIIVIILCLLALIIFYLIGFLETSSLYSWALTSVTVFFCVAPYLEIKKSIKRLEIIASRKGNQLTIVTLENHKHHIQIDDIMKVKIYKVPFITFGTLVIYTQTQKYICKYIKDIEKVYKALELENDERSKTN